MSIYYYLYRYIDRYWNRFQEPGGYIRFIKDRVLSFSSWKHKRMILCARKTLHSVGPALLFFLFLYIFIYLYILVSHLTTFGSLFSIARYARSFFSASSSYPDIFCIYFQELERMLLFWNIMAVFSQRTVKFSILENIALYFQNLIERLFLCARSLMLARKNFRSFPGQVPRPFFKIYISIQITLSSLSL